MGIAAGEYTYVDLRTARFSGRSRTALRRGTCGSLLTGAGVAEQLFKMS
jgi:hypothetical protein